MRRLAERPANVLFLAENFFRFQGGGKWLNGFGCSRGLNPRQNPRPFKTWEKAKSLCKSNRLYGINLSGDFGSQGFERGMEEPALPLGQFVQQIRIRRDLAAGKRGATSRVGHAAANIDQSSQAPGVILLPWFMMIGDNGFKLRGHLPIRDQLPASLAMIPPEE